jgi:RNA polymerase sigma-70 factor (ECF subfamily)
MIAGYNAPMSTSKPLSSVDDTEARTSADIVARIRRGDAGAETELWERYCRGLLFLLRRRTRDPDLAQDLRQETFRIALEKLRKDGLDDPEKLAAYLRGIAVNLVSGDWRKRSRQNTSADTEVVERTADTVSSVQDSVTRADLAALIRRLIEELGVERDREMLLRFYIREEDKESICTELAITPLHFNRVLFRARQRFRALLLREERRGKIRVVE